ADVGSRQNAHVNACADRVDGCPPAGRQDLFRTLVNAVERWPFIDVAGISEPEAQSTLGQKQQVEITEFAACVLHVRRIGKDTRRTRGSTVAGGTIRIGRGGVQRVRLQRVVPPVVILAEHGVEVVPANLSYSQAGDVLRIAAITEVAEV